MGNSVIEFISSTMMSTFKWKKKLINSSTGVQTEIRRDAKPLTLLQLDKQYQQWLIQMHEKYDEEVDCGIDEPVFIVNPVNKKELHIASDGEKFKF